MVASKTFFDLRRPRIPYLLITFSDIILGLVTLSVGVSAFTTTPQYRVGGFWAGLLTFLLGVYRSGVALVRCLSIIKKQYKYKSIMTIIMLVISTVCLLACVSAAIMDTMALLLLQQIDFSYCSFTDTNRILSPCLQSECSHVQFPSKTCYCCQVMEAINGDNCDVRLLTGRQYHYSGVDSCTDIAVWLKIKLLMLVIFHVVSGILCITGMCKTSPIIHVIKTEKGREFAKLKKKAKNVDDLYTLVQQEDNQSDDDELYVEASDEIK